MPAAPRRRAPRLLGGLLALVVGVTVAAYGPGDRLLADPGASSSPSTTAPSTTPTPGATVSSGAGAAGAAAPAARRTTDVVGLGDSVTSGEHCSCDDYVTAFGTLLHKTTGAKVRTRNDGESGSTSTDLSSELKSDHGLRTDIRRADVVLVTTGANDLTPALKRWRSGSCPPGCYEPLVATMSTDLGTVLRRLVGLGMDPSDVLVSTYWNVFTDGDVAKKAEEAGYLAWSDTVTRAADQAICRTTEQAGARCVDLYAPFKGRDGSTNPTSLLARDGDHPNAAGTALISRTVLAVYQRR